jgi:hypothetical protein
MLKLTKNKKTSGVYGALWADVLAIHHHTSLFCSTCMEQIQVKPFFPKLGISPAPIYSLIPSFMIYIPIVKKLR